MKNNLMIIGFNIKCNEKGLYSLNDIHRASGGATKNTPARWLERKGTQDLIESALKRLNKRESRSQKWDVVLDVNNGGSDQGVYAHELLVISYAGWIDSDFQIEVNHTFLETIREKAKALELENSKLIDFKDEIYRRESINAYLSRDYKQFDRDVIKSIKAMIQRFSWQKEVPFRDFAYSSNYGRSEVFLEAWGYMERNILECINDTTDRDKQIFAIKSIL